MAYKMKGPAMYPNYRGNKPAQQVISVNKTGNPGAADGRAASSPFQMKDEKKPTKKKAKTKEDYIKEGFTPADADKMMKDGATTGKQKSPAKFFGKLAKGIGGALGGAVKGKGVLGAAMNPVGALGNATGLFMKGKKKSPVKAIPKSNKEKAERLNSMAGKHSNDPGFRKAQVKYNQAATNDKTSGVVKKSPAKMKKVKNAVSDKNFTGKEKSGSLAEIKAFQKDEKEAKTGREKSMIRQDIASARKKGNKKSPAKGTTPGHFSMPERVQA
tara:strand:+ start:341 stop:1153 length:813 start_codon:yes stop_codon:yes gene_type:complete